MLRGASCEVETSKVSACYWCRVEMLMICCSSGCAIETGFEAACTVTSSFWSMATECAMIVQCLPSQTTSFDRMQSCWSCVQQIRPSSRGERERKVAAAFLGAGGERELGWDGSSHAAL
jgi:hypothetical protein